MYGRTTINFALEAHPSTLTQFVTDADGTDATPRTLPEFITAQLTDEFCQNAARQFGQNGTEITRKKEGLNFRCVLFDEDLQKAVPQSLRQRLPNLSQHLPYSGYSGQLCIFDVMQRDF